MNHAIKQLAARAAVLPWLAIVANCGGSGPDTVENPDPPTNNAPTISGSPSPAVNVDELWSFTPTAADVDGDALTFSVENSPAWTTFDSNSGLLQGTPTAADVGLHADIRITVSDGSLNSSLGPFSIEVTQAALGSVTLNWSLPSLNVDGSSLSNISSVNIYYGQSPGSYPTKIEITNTGTVSYVVEDLVPDTYYFVLTITDDQDIESDWSNEVAVTVD